MEKTTTKNKIIIQWFERAPDDTITMQVRRYNDEAKADSFVDRLYKKGITSCVKKTTEKITFDS